MLGESLTTCLAELPALVFQPLENVGVLVSTTPSTSLYRWPNETMSNYMIHSRFCQQKQAHSSELLDGVNSWALWSPQGYKGQEIISLYLWLERQGNRLAQDLNPSLFYSVREITGPMDFFNWQTDWAASLFQTRTTSIPSVLILVSTAWAEGGHPEGS